MCYMDQGMDCIRGCDREHSQFSTGVCLTCEAKEREAKRKSEWDAKTPLEQAISHLESWANPQHMTFSQHDAKFVLGVVKSLAAPPSQPDSERDAVIASLRAELELAENAMMPMSDSLAIMAEQEDNTAMHSTDTHGLPG